MILKKGSSHKASPNGGEDLLDMHDDAERNPTSINDRKAVFSTFCLLPHLLFCEVGTIHIHFKTSFSSAPDQLPYWTHTHTPGSHIPLVQYHHRHKDQPVAVVAAKVAIIFMVIEP